MKASYTTCPHCVIQFSIDPPITTNANNQFKVDCVHCGKPITCRLNHELITIMAMDTNGIVYDVVDVADTQGLIYTRIANLYGGEFNSGVNPWVRSFNLIFDIPFQKIPLIES